MPYYVQGGAYAVDGGAYRAGQGRIVDTFDEQSLAAWNNETQKFDFTTATTVQGDAALTTPGSHTFAQINSQPGDGLANYPAHGSRSRLFVYSDTADASCYVEFGRADSSNTIDVRLQMGGDRLALRETVNGTRTTPDADFSVNWQSATWYQLDLIRDNGTFGGANHEAAAELAEYDPVTGETTAVTTIRGDIDPSHDGDDGVGFLVDSDFNPVYDNWRIVDGASV